MTLRLALDYSYARPSGQELADAGIVFAIAYTGQGKPVPTREYLDDLRAHGVGFAFVGESYATRGFEGYSAGFVDAHYDDNQAASRGYPAGCVIFRALADTSNVAGHEGAIAEYARGYRDGLADASGRYVAGGYGPKAACEAARPYMQWLWGVWTWGYGFGVCPDPPPPDASLYQDANRPPPLPETDTNVISDLGIPYWRPDGQPAPAPQRKDARMWIGLYLGLDQLVHALKIAGSVIVGEYDPNGPRDPGYGIPLEALNSGLHIERIDTMQTPGGYGTALDLLNNTTRYAQVDPNLGGGGTPVPPTEAEVIAAANALVASGKAKFEGTTLVDV